VDLHGLTGLSATQESAIRRRLVSSGDQLHPRSTLGPGRRSIHCSAPCTRHETLNSSSRESIFGSSNWPWRYQTGVPKGDPLRRSGRVRSQRVRQSRSKISFFGAVPVPKLPTNSGMLRSLTRSSVILTPSHSRRPVDRGNASERRSYEKTPTPARLRRGSNRSRVVSGANWAVSRNVLAHVRSFASG